MLKNKYHMRALVLLGLAAVAGIAQAFGVVDLTTSGAGLGLAAMAMGGEMDVKGVTEALAKVTDQVREAGEKALAEAKKGVDMSAATKQTVDELLIKQSEYTARLDDVEQKAARRAGADEAAQSSKSIGYRAIENADFKAKAERMAGGERGSNRFEAKALTTVSSGANIVADRQAGVIMLPERPMTVRDLITPGRTSSNSVSYMKQTGFTNNAAPTAEGTRKPESTMVMALSTANVVKLAHFMKASTEILADFPALQSMIDGQLVYGLNYVEELQLLKGSGATGNLNGIYTQATAYAAPFAVASPTNIDTLRLALLQSELALLPSTGMVLHPTNWAAIELLKDTQGRYLIGNPQGNLSPTLWGRPVVTSLAMTVNTFLTGAFKMGAQVFDREQSGIIIATENEDDWVNNLIAIMAEERLALAVYRPEAFIRGALTAP